MAILTAKLWNFTVGSQAAGGSAELLPDLGYIVHYAFALAAAEHHPHLHGPWKPSRAEHWVRWPAVAVLVAGWMTYFVLVPRFSRPGAFTDTSDFDQRAVYLGFLTLDAFVFLRYFLLSRRAEVWRWRHLYGVLAVAFAISLASDAVQALVDLRDERLSLAIHWLWSAPFVAFSLAFALGRRPVAPRLSGGPATSGLARLASGQAGVLAAWALLFPVVHGTLYGFGWLDEAHRSVREGLVVACVLFLGTAAVIEHRLRRRRLLAARDERRRVEDELRTREQDLRLILERRHGREELRRSEERFASAFRVSPDGLVISTLEESRILDCNPAFARLVRENVDDLIGRRATELDLWPAIEGRERILDLVRREGAVRDIDVDLEVDDRTVRLRISFETIQVGPDRYLLTVLRDRTEEWHAARPTAARAALFDRARARIRGTDERGRTTFRNFSDVSALVRARDDAPVVRWRSAMRPAPSHPADADAASEIERTVSLTFSEPPPEDA